jgi:dihydrofolate synthase / folylpolyglutamate synthase
MNITAIKTEKILPNQTTINTILQKNIHTLAEYSIVVITSKIVSMCEGSVLKKTDQNKSELAQHEADLYIPHTKSKYDVTLTIKNNLLIPTAGIDESNSNGHFVFWPKNPQKSANNAREFLKNHFSIKHVGVIISDSKTSPLRWGTTGTSIAYSGFDALNDFIGKPDIFGRQLTMTKVNVVDALAGSAVLTMGESDEQTPLAIISDIPFVHFQDRNPTEKELLDLHISIEDDVYAPLLTSVSWKKPE